MARDKAMVAREGEVMPTLLQKAQQRLAVAEDVAKLLTATIEKHKLFSEIVFTKREGGKVVSQRKARHVRFEGWTTAGTLLEFIMGESVHPVTVWTKPLPFPEGRGPSDYQGTYGYAARVEARTGEGRVLGGAETSVTRDEDRWRNADDYAIMSMAQTRAGSKALRGPLGWIVALAGFDQTPAEEMEGRAVNGAESSPRRTPTMPPQKYDGWACSKCGRGSLEWQKEHKQPPIPGSERNCPGCGHVRGAKPPATPEGESAVDEAEGISAGAEGEPVDVTPTAKPPDDVPTDEEVRQLQVDDAARDAAKDAETETETEVNRDEEAADDAEAEPEDSGSPYP